MDDKRITDAIAGIEPESGARARMYHRIQEKTAARKKAPSPFLLFRRSLAPACACLILLLCSVFVLNRSGALPGDSVPGGDLVGTPGYSGATAEEIKALGYTLNLPAEAEDVKYAIYDGKIASADFLFRGHAYTLTASDQSGDFSGINGVAVKTVILDAATDAKLYQIDTYTSLCWKAVFSDGKSTYFLTNTDGAEESAMTAVCFAVLQK